MQNFLENVFFNEASEKHHVLLNIMQ